LVDLAKKKLITAAHKNKQMKIILLLLSFTIFASETCDKKKKSTQSLPGEQSIPACVQVKIDSIKKLPRFNPPAEVNEYTYKDKRIFLFSSDCCDNFNLLFDDNCKYVCAPTGGITGKGDMSCTDFTKEAKLVRQVWKDERK
jgi:hypothetical protein